MNLFSKFLNFFENFSFTKSLKKKFANAYIIVAPTDKENTTIVQGKGESKAILGRVEEIKREIAQSDSSYDQEKLQERLAKLSGGVAVVKVGAATETELKEKKHRVEDALSATRAAVEEGIVSGGGTALVQLIPTLEAEVKALKEA